MLDSSPLPSRRSTRAPDRRVWLADLFRGRKRAALDTLTGMLSEKGGFLHLPSPLGRSFLVTNDARFLRRVLVTSNARYDTSDVRGIEESFRANTLPNGLPAWRVMHALSNRFPVTERGFCDALTAETAAAFETFAKHQASETDLASFASSLWGDALAHVLFGRSIPGLADQVAVGFDALLGRLASPWIHSVPGFVRVPTPENRRFLRTVRDARKAVAEQVRIGASTDWCVMAQLARESSPAFSDADKLEIAMAFFFNSSATVSSTLAWLLWHIALDPALQQQLRVEMSGCRASGSPITPLLDACLAEALRMYTPIHLGRHALEDDHVADGDPVRAGTDVISNAWLIHRNPAIWPEPEVFRPARFLDRRVPWSEYLPFSMGPRGCPGRTLSYAAIRHIVQCVMQRVALEAVETPGEMKPDVPEFQPTFVVLTLPKRLPVRFVPMAACEATSPESRRFETSQGPRSG